MYAFSTLVPLATRSFQARSHTTTAKRPFSHCTTRRHTLSTIRCSADSMPRRRFGSLLAALAAGLAVSPSSALAAAAPLALGKREADEMHGFSFAVPASGWTRSTASLSPLRTATIYLCEDDQDSNISMVSTPVPGDFQKLGSFGTLENVLNTIIPSGRKDVDGKVISTRLDSDKNAYIIEYTITSSGVQRHLLTVFSLQPGRYVLTLTGQAREDNWAAREPVMRAVTDSFILNKFD